jgi:hypothetical protein
VYGLKGCRQVLPWVELVLKIDSCCARPWVVANKHDVNEQVIPAENFLGQSDRNMVDRVGTVLRWTLSVLNSDISKQRFDVLEWSNTGRVALLTLICAIGMDLFLKAPIGMDWCPVRMTCLCCWFVLAPVRTRCSFRCVRAYHDFFYLFWSFLNIFWEINSVIFLKNLTILNHASLVNVTYKEVVPVHGGTCGATSIQSRQTLVRDSYASHVFWHSAIQLYHRIWHDRCT